MKNNNIIDNKDELVILGVDPGLERTGLGLIKISNDKPEYISHYLVKTKKAHTLEKRLQDLFEQATTILSKYKIDHIVVEELFVGINRNTIIKLSMARSIMLLIGAQHNAITSHVPTRLVKQKVTGHGGAEKEEVLNIVCSTLKINLEQKDCSDALACALYYFLINKKDQELVTKKTVRKKKNNIKDTKTKIHDSEIKIKRKTKITSVS